ncbi:MAG: histidine kinase [Planctomycetota bacterium]
MSEKVLMLSGDLLFASRVRAAAESAGKSFSLSGNLPDQPDGDVEYVVVDLATRFKVVEGLTVRCQDVCPTAKVVAFGPHVQVDRLKAAREEGIQTVLTRGQFDSSLGTLFAS